MGQKQVGNGADLGVKAGWRAHGEVRDNLSCDTPKTLTGRPVVKSWATIACEGC